MASLISGSGPVLTVRARQHLKTSAAVEKFNEQLSARINAIIEKGQTPTFDDFDISQNPIPFEQFEAMISIFQTSGVHVQRLRMFGCATLDDNVMFLFADWLRTVTPETAPYEMHISDCALTLEGFNHFMEAVESNDAFPTYEAKFGKSAPLYVRIENNYIQPEDAIKDKVAEGVIVEYRKNSGPLRGAVPSNPDAKIKLLCSNPGKYGQRQGPPPAAEDAPAPKAVYDRYAEEQAAKKGIGKGARPQQQQQGYGAQYGQGYGAQAWNQQAAWQALPAWGGGYAQYQAPQTHQYQQPSYNSQPAWQQPQAQYTGRPVSQVQHKPQVVAAAQSARGQPAFNAFAKPVAQAVGTGAQRAQDRSRTPQPKTKVAPLPAGWEEHYSDEYQIPYYWHAVSGESAWERPTSSPV